MGHTAHRRRELAKLGIKDAKSTVDKYRVRSRRTLSPTWKAFLKNHVNDLVSIDFFIVPTVRFRLLFVLVVLGHSRRKVLHFNVTENPSARWTAQQIVEAFPWDAPKYLLRARDAIYGEAFQNRLYGMGSSRFSAHREVRGRTPQAHREPPYLRDAVT